MEIIHEIKEYVITDGENKYSVRYDVGKDVYSIKQIMNLPKDIEPLFGLWVLFELPKCSDRYQKKVISEIKKGIYPKKVK